MAPFVTLSPHKDFFTTDDGRPFFWLADTWWYALTDRALWPHPFQEMVEKRVRQGFTVAMVVVGVPPEVPLYSSEANSDGQHPFLQDFRPNPLYFDAIEKKVVFMIEHGLVPCLVGGWGHQMDSVGEERFSLFWKEIIRRFSKYPVVWCLTGEVDIGTPSLHPSYSFLKQVVSRLPEPVKVSLRTLKHSLFIRPLISTPVTSERVSQQILSWKKVAEALKDEDKTNKLLLVHPNTQQASSAILGQPTWLDVDSIQSGHDPGSRLFMVSEAYQRSKQKIFVNLEPIYEGILGNDDPELQRYAFWMSILAGAKGHSYGADGLWNMRTADQFLSHWGSTVWNEALQRPGAEQLGKAIKWLEESVEWWTLQPSLNAITPHWNSTQESIHLPLCAKTANGTIVCYFPKKRQAKYYVWNDVSKVELTWIDPCTMTLVESPHYLIDGQEHRYDLSGTQSDLLLIAKPVQSS